MIAHILGLWPFAAAFLFWLALYHLNNKLIDKFERKHADHHRR